MLVKKKSSSINLSTSDCFLEFGEVENNTDSTTTLFKVKTEECGSAKLMPKNSYQYASNEKMHNHSETVILKIQKITDLF